MNRTSEPQKNVMSIDLDWHVPGREGRLLCTRRWEGYRKITGQVKKKRAIVLG
jgi:hypothetical protein